MKWKSVVLSLLEELVKVRGMEIDQNGDELGTLNENGRLPVGVMVMIHMHIEFYSCMCR